MSSLKPEQRLEVIEKRLEQIENHLGIPAKYRASTHRAGMEEAIARAEHQTQTTPAARPAQPQAATRVYNLEDTTPTNWLALVAIACFVLAAGFIIKLSIDSGWLTPVRQLGIAATFGIGLIGAGIALLKTDKDYAAYLPAAGIIVLHLTALASNMYYEVLSLHAAIGCALAVSAGCIGLYYVIRSEVYPLLSAIGCYLMPSLMGFDTNPMFLIYVFLFCSCAFAVIAHSIQSRALTLVAAYLAIMLSASVGFSNGLPPQFIALVVFLNFMVFLMATFVYSVAHRQPLTEPEAWSFFPVLLIFYVTEYAAIQAISPPAAPVVSLVFAALMLGVYVAARRSFATMLASHTPMVAYLCMAVFHSGYLVLMPEAYRPLLLPTLLFASALTASASGKARPAWLAYPLIVVLAIAVIEYARIFLNILDTNTTSWLALSGVTVLGLLAVRSSAAQHSATVLLVFAAHVMAVMGLYQLASPHGSLAVSGAWLFYAVAIMGWGILRKDEYLAKSAMVVLGLAALKALLYDAASAPTIIRIVCLLVTGCVLYGSGLVLRQIPIWIRR